MEDIPVYNVSEPCLWMLAKAGSHYDRDGSCIVVEVEKFPSLRSIVQSHSPLRNGNLQKSRGHDPSRRSAKQPQKMSTFGNGREEIRKHLAIVAYFVMKLVIACNTSGIILFELNDIISAENCNERDIYSNPTMHFDRFLYRFTHRFEELTRTFPFDATLSFLIRKIIESCRVGIW